MKKVFLFILFISIFSCEKIVDLNIPPHNPLLVLNGILDTDSISSVFVSHSVGAFDEGEINCIVDANVLLYEDDILLGQMIIDSSHVDTFTITEDGWWNQINEELIYYYKLNSFPKSGSVYSINVNHPNYESVFGPIL